MIKRKPYFRIWLGEYTSVQQLWLRVQGSQAVMTHSHVKICSKPQRIWESPMYSKMHDKSLFDIVWNVVSIDSSTGFNPKLTLHQSHQSGMLSRISVAKTGDSDAFKRCSHATIVYLVYFFFPMMTFVSILTDLEEYPLTKRFRCSLARRTQRRRRDENAVHAQQLFYVYLRELLWLEEININHCKST